LKVLGYGFLVATYILVSFLAAFWDGGNGVALILAAQSISSIPFLFIARLAGKEAFVKRKYPTLRGWIHTIPYLLAGLAITAAIANFGSFFAMLFIVYLGPNLHAYSKISRLFGAGKGRAWFTVVFVVLAALFPLSGRILPVHDGASRIAEMMGNYYAPVLMYVFLLFLAVDY